MTQPIRLHETGSPGRKQSFTLADAAEAYCALASERTIGATVPPPHD